MLVSASEMLKKAVEGHYAVGHFNMIEIGRASCRERV